MKKIIILIAICFYSQFNYAQKKQVLIPLKNSNGGVPFYKDKEINDYYIEGFEIDNKGNFLALPMHLPWRFSHLKDEFYLLRARVGRVFSRVRQPFSESGGDRKEIISQPFPVIGVFKLNNDIVC